MAEVTNSDALTAAVRHMADVIRYHRGSPDSQNAEIDGYHAQHDLSEAAAAAGVPLEQAREMVQAKIEADDADDAASACVARAEADACDTYARSTAPDADDLRHRLDDGGTVWNPTHRITFAPRSGKPTTWEVMRSDGCLYTRDEWEHESAADWEIDDADRVTFQGQATPHGASGTVTIAEV
jgi:hypothetical protein